MQLCKTSNNPVLTIYLVAQCLLHNHDFSAANQKEGANQGVEFKYFILYFAPKMDL